MDTWTAELRRWPMVIVLALGQASNILTVLVLARRRLRKNTCSLYLIGASVSNTICIFVGLFYIVISSGFGYSLVSQSRIWCKLLPFMYYTTLFLASWFILLACTDRYCSTHSKVSIRRFSDIKIAKRLLIILPLLACIVHIHLLIYVDWIAVGRCTFLIFNYIIFLYIYYVVVYAFMTPILYFIFAILTIYNVQKTKKTVALAIQKHGSIINPQKRQLSLNAQLLRMLLVQVISFVILTMPLAAWNVYIGITAYTIKSSRALSIEALISVIFRFLTFINIGSTCVVYTLTARLFREELWALLQCQSLKTAIRREQQFRLFTVSRRIVPTS